jgi:cytochrome c biogenesis protein CcmG/thiol:disulfide interchange protein DsbE
MRTATLTAQLVALTAVAALLVVLIWHLTHQPAHAKAGAAAPTFVLQRIDDDSVVDLSKLRGKPVVLNFWASWCPPCKGEARTLERLWRRYRKQGVVFVGVDSRDHDSDALRFMRAHGITYPVVRDPNGSIASDSYNILDLPMTFFIDRRGRLVSAGIRGRVDHNLAAFDSGLKAALGS